MPKPANPRKKETIKAPEGPIPPFAKQLLGSSTDLRTNKWRLTCGACGKQWEPPTTMHARNWETCPKCHREETVDYNAN